MGYTLDDLYGSDPTQQQPTPTAAPTHAPGTEEPVARTTPLGGTGSRFTLNKPALVLVGMLGLAILLSQLAVHGEVNLGVSA